ncbi:hypothetical protein JOF41_005740 [Saccharothrix coeruleofusca]|uniref:DUF397 domain-containing protein n=1 Tax=Saccharothrix coeruleofusca TaxID=33919 RepID=UPI001AE15119|nr:DUF397 domain-containing protein [Saccharothrix coeruleofusca]MBP2339562.1 hypothetical protein [Saccharothrix coeruleofusca]
MTPTPMTWRKSSRSQNQGACVECAVTTTRVGVRDSKNPTPTLDFPRSTWTDFLRAQR